MEKDGKLEKDGDPGNDKMKECPLNTNLFNEDERKIKIKETKKIICKEYVHSHERIVLWLYWRHAIIYLVFIIISIGLIALTAIPKVRDNELISNVFTALGTGLIGSIIFAIAINISDNRKEILEKVAQYNSSIASIFYSLWQIYSCHEFSYLKNIKPENGKQIVVLQMASKVATNMGIALQYINKHNEEHYKLLTKETKLDLEMLEEQLMQMKNSLEYPINLNNQIDILCSIHRKFKYVNAGWLKKQLRII